MDEYNRVLQRDLAKSVWAADKQSWYKLADGTITNNWPHSTMRYRYNNKKNQKVTLHFCKPA